MAGGNVPLKRLPSKALCNQALNPDGRYRPTLVENGGYIADRLISAVMPAGKGPVTTFLENVLIHTSLMPHDA